MKTIQGVLLCALLAAMTALVGHTILLVRAATAVVVTVPVEIDSTRAALVAQIEGTRRDLSQQVTAARQLRRNSRLYRLLGVKAPEEVARADLSLDISKGANFSLIESALIYFAGRPDASLADVIAFIDSRSFDLRQ